MNRDILTILFLLLIVASSYSKEFYPTIPTILLVSYMIGMLIRNRSEQRRMEFINQLKSCRNELRSGGTVVVDGMLVRYSTILTSYQLQVGGLVSSIEIHTPFRPDKGGDHAEALVLSLTSLVTGWWSLSGPLATFNTVYRNLRGGNRTTVALLIDQKLIEKLHFLESLKGSTPAETVEPKPDAAPHDGLDTGPGSPSGNQIGESRIAKLRESLENTFESLEQKQAADRIKHRIRHLSLEDFRRFMS